jgi:glycosyltransferase involved in cell wall biosynthesis
MNYNPLVTVIVAAYNSENYISNCIESIISQSYDNIEIIVVDDGSTDKTAEIVKRYKKEVRYFYQMPSGSPAGPRNTGLLQSSGDYLCFCDNDDLLVKNRIAMQADFLQRHSDVGIVFCDYRNFDDNSLYEKSHFQTCPRIGGLVNNCKELVLNNACNILSTENFGICGTFMMRRELLEYETGFNESLIGTDDFDFYYRLARHTKVGIINEVGLMRRLHSSNLSSNSYIMTTNAIRCRTLLRASEKDVQTKVLLDRYLAACWSSLSRYEANHGRYIKAFKNEFMALKNNFCGLQLFRSLRNFLRTTLIALGFHDPKEC